MARKNVSSGDFVTVACKLPQGLHIVLPGIELKLHGSASPYALGGHGMTQVNAAQWAAVEDHFGKGGAFPARWLETQAVFAMNKPEDANDKAVEREKVRVGFEPIDPKDPSNGLPGAMHIQHEGAADQGV